MAGDEERRRPNVESHASEILLARLDERLNSLVNDIREMRAQMVSQQEFKPIRMTVYGVIALMLTGVITALLATVVK